MKNITKNAITQEISRRHSLDPKFVLLTINTLFEYITERLANNDRFEFRDFGVFETILRKEKIGRNPKRADVSIVIPARRAVKFSPGKIIKKKIS